MSAICGASARVVCNSAIYKDKDEAANRRPAHIMGFAFSKATLKSAVAIPEGPKLHRESQPPIV